jgi:transcriptional regulator GlxA family with amidase domain
MKALETRADALPAIAREAGASASHLHALFAREAGMGPAGWRRALRLARAAELLRDTALPVAAIGAECGYGDPAAFTRAFARRYAVPPSAYRARFS